MDTGSDIKTVDEVSCQNPMTAKNPNGDSLLLRTMVDASSVRACVAGRRGHARLGVVKVTMESKTFKYCR
jgi:hypothetical protein